MMMMMYKQLALTIVMLRKSPDCNDWSRKKTNMSHLMLRRRIKKMTTTKMKMKICRVKKVRVTKMI